MSWNDTRCISNRSIQKLVFLWLSREKEKKCKTIDLISTMGDATASNCVSCSEICVFICTPFTLIWTFCGQGIGHSPIFSCWSSFSISDLGCIYLSASSSSSSSVWSAVLLEWGGSFSLSNDFDVSGYCRRLSFLYFSILAYAHFDRSDSCYSGSQHLSFSLVFHFVSCFVFPFLLVFRVNYRVQVGINERQLRGWKSSG